MKRTVADEVDDQLINRIISDIIEKPLFVYWSNSESGRGEIAFECEAESIDEADAAFGAAKRFRPETRTSISLSMFSGASKLMYWARKKRPQQELAPL
jgi:hypothetical protein